ncbi:MAG: hypothetical protein KF760_08675 [Candidatus Eremiobacteraeota bacterium]|nr:hypothetical protein [Candidatus Eremiobacteraeota bacterium]MCW5870700.1 hypothetical protein [Candidatus Eremiobacteraeota bacterium]
MQINPGPSPNPHLYRLLKPIVAEEGPCPLSDKVTISPQALARKVPTTLDSLLHFPERVAAVFSVAHTVITCLAGPLGIVLGSLGAVAIPTGVLAHRRYSAKQEP